MQDIHHPRPVYIYGLCSPGPMGALRYIGRAIRPRRRFTNHLARARKPTNHRECWIKGLLDRGEEPEMFIIEETDEKHWVEAERFWVDYFIAIGCDLTNRTGGGRGNYQMFAESLAAAGDKHAVYWLAIAPDGQEYRFRNLKKFCRERGLCVNNAYIVARGKRGHIKGWRFSHEGERPRELTKEHRTAPWVITYPDGQQTMTMSWKQFYRDGGCTPLTLLRSVRRGGPGPSGWHARRAIWQNGEWR